FDWDCKSFDELHRKVENQSLEEVNAVINSITICDPAVGSGHFLVSCLNELLAIKAELKVLCDVEGKRIPYLDIEVENDELAIEHNGELFEYKVNHEWKSEIVERSHAGKERQRIQQALFHEKRFLIEHCLFGVDINPNSVKICRLRLWIELLKHAYYKSEQSHPDPEDSGDGSAESGTSYTPYSELEVLPNIDINIKQGNSLVSRFGLDEDLTAIFKKSEHSLEDYKQAVKNYRETRDRNEKQRLQKLIDDIKAEYSETLLNNKPINKKLSKERGKLELMQNEDLFGGGKATKKELTAQQKKVSKLEEQKAEEEAGAFYREAFEWRFEFPEVLDDQGNYTGFDVVIGNPPYVQLQSIKEVSKDLKKLGFETYSSMGDLYALFYERGNDILKKKGMLCFISGSAWMRTNYGQSLRTFFNNKTSLTEIIDLSDCDIFDSATVLTTVVQFEKSKASQPIKAIRFTKKDQDRISKLEDIIKEEHIEIDTFPQTSWIISNRETHRIRKLVEEQGTRLRDWDIRINYGIKTGYNEAFVIDEETKNELINADPKSAELIKPILRGRDIHKYSIEFSDLWLIGTHNGVKERGIDRIDVNGYPAVKEHLDEYWERISSRYDKGDTAYNLRNCAYWFEFDEPKIIYPNMTKFLPFTLDIEGTFLNDKCFILTGEKLHFLTAFLNSKLFKLCFSEAFPELQGNTKEIKKFILEEIPVKYPNDEESFINKVDQIFTLKKENPDTNTSKLEAEIDQMVYELYGLTEEEIAIVEESVG
ncbi:MAG: TaqI-like C-terminal specificity domain-containing protein, partial [Balneola sp.]